MYFEREKLSKKLGKMCETSLTVIHASAGCGKATALYEMFKDNNYAHVWLNLSDAKDSQYIWSEILDEVIKLKSLPLDFITKVIPTTEGDINNFFRIMNKILDEDIYVVLKDFDDRYLDKLKYILCNLCEFENNKLHYIVVTEKVTDRLLMDCIYQQKCFTVTSEDFRFTESEIKEMAHLNSIELNHDEISELMRFTEGWLPTINIALSSYKQTGNIFSTSTIYDYVERELLNHCSEELKLDLAKLAIVNEFSLELASALCENTEIISFIMNAELNSIILKKLGYNRYFFSTMMKDYLKYYLNTHLDNLESIYKKAGRWYLNNNNPIKAISTYLDGGLFAKIFNIFDQSEISYMDVVPALIQEVFQKMPNDYKYNYPIIYLRYICDCMTNIDYYSGIKLLEQFKTDLELGKYIGDEKQLIGEYYYIRAFSKFNDVKEMMSDFHLAYDCFGGGKSRVAYPNMVATFGSCHLLYLYHREVGQLESLVQTIQDEVGYYIHISHGVNSGSAYLAKAEYNFETGNFDNVLFLSKLAYQEALAAKQISICIASLFLQGRYAIFKGNQLELASIFGELNLLMSMCNVPILVSELECAISYLNLLTNKLHLVCDWIKDDNITELSLLHEASSMAYVILILYHLKKNNYEAVISCCNFIESYCIQQMHVFGMIYAKLGKFIVYHISNNPEKALINLNQLIDLTNKDHIITVFIENKELLGDILPKYKVNHPYYKSIIKAVFDEGYTNINDLLTRTLTKKEFEVVQMFIKSNSVQETAEKLFISKNTVKTHLKNIYRRLNVSNKEELVILVKGKE